MKADVWVEDLAWAAVADVFRPWTLAARDQDTPAVWVSDDSPGHRWVADWGGDPSLRTTDSEGHVAEGYTEEDILKSAGGANDPLIVFQSATSGAQLTLYRVAERQWAVRLSLESEGSAYAERVAEVLRRLDRRSEAAFIHAVNEAADEHLV